MTLGVIISTYEFGEDKNTQSIVPVPLRAYSRNKYSLILNLKGIWKKKKQKPFVVLLASSVFKRKKKRRWKIARMLENVYRDTFRDFLLMQKKKKLGKKPRKLYVVFYSARKQCKHKESAYLLYPVSWM